MSRDRRSSSGIDLSSSKWEGLPDMSKQRTFAASAAVDEDRLVVVGGVESGTEAVACVSMYDSRNTRKWTELPNMRTGRWACAAATTNGKVYVVGGRTGKRDDTSALEALDMSTKEWEQLTPMFQKLRGCAAVASRRFLYVFGGYQFNSATRRGKFVSYTSCYDLKTNQWKNLPPMATARGWSAAAIVNGKAYIAGGKSLQQSALETVEIFDLKSWTWRDSPLRMQTPRCEFAVVAIGSLLVVIGGKGTDGKELRSIEVYDTIFGKWVSFRMPSLTTPRSAFTAEVLGGGQIILAGGHGNAACSTEKLVLPQLQPATMKVGVRGQSLFGDIATGEDLLGIEAQAKALGDTISFKDLATPFVIGLLGGWGSGKSFTFNLIKKRLIEIQSHDLSIPKNKVDYPYVGHIYLVKFDAWTFGKGNLWASLMYKILVDLNDQLDLESIIRGDQTAVQQDAGDTGDSGKDNAGFTIWSIWQKCLKNRGKITNSVTEDEEDDDRADAKSADDTVNSLLRGISIIQLMDKLSDNDREYFRRLIKDEGLPDKIAQYDLKSGNITHALVKAVDDQSKEDKERLLEKQKELAWKYIECKSRIKRKGALYTLLGDAFAKYKEMNRESEQQVPKSIDEALDAFNWLGRNWRLFFTFELSLWGWVFFLLSLAGTAIAVVVAVYFQEELMVIIAPVAGTFAAVVGKVRNTYKQLGPTFTRALQHAHNEEDHIESGAWIDLELQDKDKENPLRLKQLKVEIDSLQQRVWIKEGESLADVVKARVETSDYQKELGIVHQAQTDLNRLAEGLISNKSKQEIFPRGDPRVVIFIDDLDRCPPRKVVETLEAVQLLVKTNLFVVVMAIDARYVTLSLEKEYSDILDPHRSPSGLDYLEKIIQLPYRISPINREEDMESYLRGQMDIPTGTVSKSESFHEFKWKNVSMGGNESDPEIESNSVHEPLHESNKELQQDSGPGLAGARIFDDSFHEQILTTIPSKPIFFTEEELETLKLACVAAYVTPRAAKRLVNVFKLIKIIWYNRPPGGIEVRQEQKDGCLLLLAMCASKTKPLRLGMCKAFEMLEKKIEVTDLGKFLEETLGSILKGRCKGLVQKMLSKDALDWETFKEDFWLVRSFSFVGENSSPVGDVQESSPPPRLSGQEDSRLYDTGTPTFFRSANQFLPNFGMDGQEGSHSFSSHEADLDGGGARDGLRKRNPSSMIL